jgi:NAD+ synthase (glutamine-hydrolysing)
MASFSEDVHIVDTEFNKDKTQHSGLNCHSSKFLKNTAQRFTPLCDMENLQALKDHKWKKYHRIWSCMLYAQKQIFKQCNIQKAQVHISGGIDSAIVAVLCAKAMGSENCVFISNPSKHNGSFTQNNAQHIADKLNTNLYWIPIQETVDSCMQTCTNGLDKDIETSQLAVGTAEATTRAVIGLSVANFYGSGIVSTGNHTENVLGWFTFHDIGSIGVYQPLGDLSKLELFDLAEFINSAYNDDYIPRELWDELVRVQPAAELADSSDDPFDYQIYSGICSEIIRNKALPSKLMRDFDSKNLNEDAFPITKCYDYYGNEAAFEKATKDAYQRSKRSVYKCAQAAPLLIMSPRSRGFSSRETIINFYNPK